MSEYIEEKRGGIGFSGVVGGIAGGLALGKIADTQIARRGIKKALPELYEIVEKLRFITDKKNGGFALYAKTAGEQGEILMNFAKLPQGMTTGKTFGKEGLQKIEKDLITAIRKEAGFFAGLKGGGWGGRLTIGAAAIAGIAVGGMVLQKIFGPRKVVKTETIENAGRLAAPEPAIAKA